MRSRNRKEIVHWGTCGVLLGLVCGAGLRAVAQGAPRKQLERTLELIRGMPSPEDLIRLPGTGWVIVSSMGVHPDREGGVAGRLFAVRQDGPWRPQEIYPAAAARGESGAGHGKPQPGQPDWQGPPDPRLLVPHGINVLRRQDGTFDLAMVNHGGRESIEFLRLTVGADGVRAEWQGCVLMPPHTYGNGVALLPGGGIVVSNMYDPQDPEYLQKFAAGALTGGVLRWTAEDGWRPAVPRRLSGANGVAVSADGRWLYVSEWSRRRLWRFSLRDSSLERSVALDFLPDNLRWSERGTLLLAGQTARPESVFGCAGLPAGCPMGFAAVEVEPRSLGVRALLRGGDDRFGGGTGVIDVGDDLWVASFHGDAVGRFRAAASHR